jgi:hypothetical protein
MTGRGFAYGLQASLHGVQAGRWTHPPSTASALADGGSRGASGRIVGQHRAWTRPLRRGAPRVRESQYNPLHLWRCLPPFHDENPEWTDRGFRLTARVTLSTHMPCAVECFGIMWLHTHPSRSPGRRGCKSTSATPMGPVWVHARYSWSTYKPSVDATCVYECGGPTHTRLAAPCLTSRLLHRRLWGLCGCTLATH